MLGAAAGAAEEVAALGEASGGAGAEDPDYGQRLRPPSTAASGPPWPSDSPVTP